MTFRRTVLVANAIVLAGTCVTTTPARAARIYGDWVESSDNAECTLFTTPADSGPIVILRARNNVKVISVVSKHPHELQAGRLILTIDQHQTITLDLVGR